MTIFLHTVIYICFNELFIYNAYKLICEKTPKLEQVGNWKKALKNLQLPKPSSCKNWFQINVNSIRIAFSARCIKQVWKVGKVGKEGKVGKVGKVDKVGKVGREGR
jgi:hypothetical protein